MAPATELRLKHLSKASKLLSLSSPSTAAHLSVNATDLLRHSTSIFSSNSTPRCRACGSAETSLQTRWPTQNRRFRRSVSNAKAELSKKQSRCLITRCLVCQRTIRQIFDAPERIQSNSPAPSATSQVPESPATKTEVRSSSKKRAKARKDRSGLQALLDKSKENTEPSAGFSLMDFMRSS